MKLYFLVFCLFISACGVGFDASKDLVSEEDLLDLGLQLAEKPFTAQDLNNDGVYQLGESVELAVNITSARRLYYQWSSDINCANNKQEIKGATLSSLVTQVTNVPTCYSVRIKLSNSNYYSFEILVERIEVGGSTGIQNPIIATPTPTPPIVIVTVAPTATPTKAPTATPTPTKAPIITATPTPTLAPPAGGGGGSTSGSDFATRCAQPGVVRCVGLDSLQEIQNFRFDTISKTNYFDSSIKSSGAGSIRFELPSNSYDNVAGALAINFSDNLQTQFGENQEFWVQWRQRFDSAFIANRYEYEAPRSGETTWKQAIIGEGDRFRSDGSRIVASSCTQLELVMQSFWRASGGHPLMYMTCGEYTPYQYSLPNFNTYYNFTNQNQRLSATGKSSCTIYEDRGDSDTSGCLKYVSDEWMTFMVNVKLGPYGTAYSKLHETNRTGFTNSTVEFYVGREGKTLEKANVDTNLVIPNEDKNIKYGKVWLLPYTSYKNPNQSHAHAKTWYDDLIISRNPIAAPSGSTTGGGTTPSPTATPTKAPATPTPTKAPAITATPTPTPTPIANPSQSSPSWVSSITKGFWQRIDTNTIADVWIGNESGYEILRGASHQGLSQFVGCWNGGAFAPNLGKYGMLLAAGGGHGCYKGNEIYGFDLEKLKWSAISSSYNGSQGWAETSNPYYGEYPDGSPIFPHTNDMVDYHPKTNSFIILVGIRNPNTGDGYYPQYGGKGFIDIMHMIDLSKGRQGKWRRSPFDPNSGAYEGGFTAYDPTRDVFWYQHYYGVTPNRFIKYDPNSTNSDGTFGKFTYYDRGDNDAYATMDQNTAEVNPLHDLFMVNSKTYSDVYARDLKNPNSPYVKLKYTGTRPASGGAAGWAWSNKRKAMLFYGRNSGDDIYEFKLISGDPLTGTWQWSNITSGQNSVAPIYSSYGPYSKFRIARFADGEELALLSVADGSSGTRVYGFRVP